MLALETFMEHVRKASKPRIWMRKKQKQQQHMVINTISYENIKFCMQFLGLKLKKLSKAWGPRYK